jgi:ABC-type glycerol-3-phosphate transport system permease component
MKLQKVLGKSAIHGLLIFFSLIFLIPIWWLLISSLKPIDQILTIPPIWWPQSPQWENYVAALTSPAFPFGQLMFNTLFYCVLATIGTVLSSSIVAYAFARMRFVGRNLLFGITLATLLLPGVVTLIPTYVLFQRMGMVGTYAPLIVPYFFGSAFNIFLLRQFMLTIPQELSDAAYVDGAGDFLILWRIMLPLVRPAVIVVAIFNFIYAWNDFLGPLLYLDDASKYPFAIGLYAFRTRFALQWNLLTAAALSITLPLIVAFFLLQRHFIEGVTLTGVKG